ncbi:Glutaredoxin-like protein nrdH [Actinomyces viscosus]|uniref:Glutaredoxin-like protein nrdH n=2 Tax=Actinomyces viscosus TaxID=1656 RepID=A0A448PPM3_ACTVI|nr:Glutaredoxin-like protein nrdH [Actinomyces viscosus]
MVEYLPSGVVYAATEDLPAAARQVIEGLTASTGPGSEIEWRGPGPAAADVDIEVAWDDQAQAVAYSVRGRPERTVALDDLNQALAQDWDHYRQDVDAAGQLLERLDAITNPAGLGVEETQIGFDPYRRTVTAQVMVLPERTEHGLLPTPGMRGELTVEETGQRAFLGLQGAQSTGRLTDEHARQLLSYAVQEARREPGQAAWEALHPHTAGLRDHGLEVEDPALHWDRMVGVSVQVHPPAVEAGPLGSWDEQSVTFSLDGDELAIRAGGPITQELRSGVLDAGDERTMWLSPDLAAAPGVGEMSSTEVAATILGMSQEEFDAAASSVREGLVAARDAAAPRRSATSIFNDLRTHLIRVGSLLPDAARDTASTSFDLDRGVAWVRAQAMDASHRPITIGVPVDPDSPLLEVVDRQVVEPGTVGPWVDPTPLSDAERYEAATPVSEEQAGWDIDSAVLRDADEHTARTWATWRAAGAQGWSTQEAAALERWAQAQATLAGDDAHVTIHETVPGSALETDTATAAAGRLIDLQGGGLDCRVATTSPGEVTVATPAGVATMTTTEMMDQVRASWPDTTTQTLEHISGRDQALDLGPQVRERAETAMLTVYTTPSCMGCEMTRRQLDKAGVAYEAVDLSGRPDLVEQFRAEGLRQAPIIETPDGQRTAGFDPARIKAIVAAATPQQATGSPGQSSDSGGARPSHTPHQRSRGHVKGMHL